MSTIVGIAGSARKKGNSATLLRALLKGAAAAGGKTKEIYLNGRVFKGCQGCLRCSPHGKCILKDELTPVLEELRRAQGWVLASPIYYDGVTGPLKTFFDRLRTFTVDPQTQELKPQLAGKRRAVILVTYEDKPRQDYYRQAGILADYLSWMGDFSQVRIISEGGLGPPEAAAQRPGLVAQMEKTGKDLLEGL